MSPNIISFWELGCGHIWGVREIILPTLVKAASPTAHLRLSMLPAAASAVSFHYLPLAVTLGDKHPHKACHFSSFYLHCSFDQHLNFHMFVIDYV